MRLGVNHDGCATSVVDEETGRVLVGPFRSAEVARTWIANNRERLEYEEHCEQRREQRRRNRALQKSPKGVERTLSSTRPGA